jgi:hypothetical protein
MIHSEINQESIINEQYHLFPETHSIVCCLTLKNGYSVLGNSLVIDKDELNKEGKILARQDAYRKLNELEVYLHKQRLYEDIPSTKLHIEDLEKEKLELDIKLKHLHEYIASFSCQCLPIEYKMPILDQASYMKGYSDMLQKRLGYKI